MNKVLRFLSTLIIVPICTILVVLIMGCLGWVVMGTIYTAVFIIAGFLVWDLLGDICAWIKKTFKRFSNLCLSV